MRRNVVDRVWNDGRMKILDNRDHFLSVRLYYSRGEEVTRTRRGYYLSVTPVRAVDHGGLRMIEMCPSDGIRCLVMTVSRRSAKADDAASDIAKTMLDGMVDRVCEKNGIARSDVGDLIFD